MTIADIRRYTQPPEPHPLRPGTEQGGGTGRVRTRSSTGKLRRGGTHLPRAPDPRSDRSRPPGHRLRPPRLLRRGRPNSGAGRGVQAHSHLPQGTQSPSRRPPAGPIDPPSPGAPVSYTHLTLPTNREV